MATPKDQPVPRPVRFSVALPNGGYCSGHEISLSSHPGDPHYAGRPKPLLIGVHGGSCTSAYFDLLESASPTSVAAKTGFPFVAIDRPEYGESKFQPAQSEKSDENDSYWLRTAKWMHKSAIPELWATYGVPNHCKAVVLIAHSMGCPPSIMTAALHSQDTASFPLGGMILSGWGGEVNNMPTQSQSSATQLHFTPEMKYTMMLTDDTCHSAEVKEALAPQSDRQNVSLPPSEAQSAQAWWFGDSSQYTSKVSIPVMHALGEKDWLWKGTPEAMKGFQKMFTASPRVDSIIIPGAPHAIEWGKGGAEYMLKCLEWASEVL